MVPALVVAEVSYLTATRLGPAIEAVFLAGMSDLDVEGSSIVDWPRIAQLVELYADFPLGGVHASIVALAERIQAETVVTLDRRHFLAVRPSHVEAFELLPA